ncbi:Uncharacterised protein [Mycobacterium tuberculosis]|nr:Uncharacterised protein [Mycobacterium tuberculosis]CNV99204.1 Uncharacterised protein [Mycobacterium tuberculosis]
MLVTNVGQRVLESGQTLAVPPAEQFLQPMGDKDRAQTDPQYQQPEILGAAPTCGAYPLVVVHVDSGRSRRYLPARLRLDVGQRLRSFDQAVPGVADTRASGIIGRDNGGGSTAKVPGISGRRQVILGVDQACRDRPSRHWPRRIIRPLPM